MSFLYDPTDDRATMIGEIIGSIFSIFVYVVVVLLVVVQLWH